VGLTAWLLLCFAEVELTHAECLREKTMHQDSNLGMTVSEPSVLDRTKIRRHPSLLNARVPMLLTAAGCVEQLLQSRR